MNSASHDLRFLGTCIAGSLASSCLPSVSLHHKSATTWTKKYFWPSVQWNKLKIWLKLFNCFILFFSWMMLGHREPLPCLLVGLPECCLLPFCRFQQLVHYQLLVSQFSPPVVSQQHDGPRILSFSGESKHKLNVRLCLLFIRQPRKLSAGSECGRGKRFAMQTRWRHLVCTEGLRGIFDEMHPSSSYSWVLCLRSEERKACRITNDTELYWNQ